MIDGISFCWRQPVVRLRQHSTVLLHRIAFACVRKRARSARPSGFSGIQQPPRPNLAFQVHQPWSRTIGPSVSCSRLPAWAPSMFDHLAKLLNCVGVSRQMAGPTPARNRFVPSAITPPRWTTGLLQYFLQSTVSGRQPATSN